MHLKLFCYGDCTLSICLINWDQYDKTVLNLTLTCQAILFQHNKAQQDPWDVPCQDPWARLMISDDGDLDI